MKSEPFEAPKGLIDQEPPEFPFDPAAPAANIFKGRRRASLKDNNAKAYGNVGFDASGREFEPEFEPSHDNVEAMGGGGWAGMEGAVISDTVKEMIADVNVKAAVLHIREGGFLLKYCQNIFRKPHQRLFWVDMDLLAIRWTSPKKGLSKTQIFLTDVERIVPGIDSDFWRNKSESERYLGIELLLSKKKLRVVCATQEEWRTWLMGLLYAHQKALTKRTRAGSLTNDLIRRHWELADLNQSGSVQFSELLILLQRLNCQADVRYAEQLFEMFDEDGSRVLEYEEFKMLIHRLLTHEDINEYFDMYRDPATMTVTDERMKQFLLDVQQTPLSQIDEQLAHVRELQEPFRRDTGVTDLGLNMLLSSEFNCIFNPAKKALWQDMGQPLCNYWIASSHNTYLTSDQVVGKSAVGQYIDVLLRSCRCVELDCWDGPNGDPIIYHGYTLTSKIPFREVVKACSDYGFKKSPYPIVFSLEMHCSAKQKARIGAILKELLGDKLFQHQPGSPAPSPAQLKHKFIVKGKIPTDAGFEEDEGNEEDLRLEEQEIKLELMSEFPEEYCVNIELFPPALPAALVDRHSQHYGYQGESLKGKDNGSSEDLSVYHNCIGMPGKQLQKFEDPARHGMHVCSLNEKKFSKVARSKPVELAKFHQGYLSRIYPSGTRLMSSNYNPMPCWIHGAQMVALNYQALGMAMMLCLGRFLENGSTGYVLKPPLLRSPNAPFDPMNPNFQLLKNAGETPITLTIKILSAQQLPIPSLDHSTTRQAGPGKRREVACPYVILTIEGIPADCCTRRTNYIANNGLNPRWHNQEFTFEVTVPTLSILVFEVRHFDNVRSEYLGGYAVPVSCIRNGIRWIPLYDSRLREINWSGLLVRVSSRPNNKIFQGAADVVKPQQPGSTSPASSGVPGIKAPPLARGRTSAAPRGLPTARPQTGAAGDSNTLPPAKKSSLTPRSSRSSSVTKSSKA